MPDASDIELLQKYHRQGSEAAFAELVQRHINLVYSVALRHVGNPAHAEEIAQAVFVILARKAAGLRPDTILEGWLHETTRMTALCFLRGERRRQFREQEAFMQSTLHETSAAGVWNQLAPLLDEALSRLGRKDRDAVMLRFFKEQSVREIATTLKISEAAAQKRILRAVEKLRLFYTRRGIVLTTAALTAAVSAHSVQAAPATLAKTATAIAISKGAITGSSTLTLIKGALKIMAWTKTKTAIIVGVGILLAAGTTTITIREIQEHRTYPWQVSKGGLNDNQVNQPPQVRILRSKSQEPDWAILNGKLIGIGVQAQNIVAAAYGQLTPVRAVFSAPLPPGRYDYIACLPGGEAANEKALQAEVKQKFGVVAKTETRDTDVWLLKVKSPRAPGLKPNLKDYGNALRTVPTGFHGWNESMFNLACLLEDMANVPIIDGTGLTNRFDFDLNCRKADLTNQDWKTVNAALDQLGLELVPAHKPIEMLMVEKSKN